MGGWQPSAMEWKDDDKVFFRKGSQAELDRLVRLAMLCVDRAQLQEWADLGSVLSINARFRKKAHVNTAIPHFIQEEPLLSLITLFLREHEPSGFQLGYDDESTYSKDPASLRYAPKDYLGEGPRERMLARRELAQWLRDRKHSPKAFGLTNIELAPPPPTQSTPAPAALADLPLFGFEQPQASAEQAEPTIRLEAHGSWIRVPFDVINCVDFGDRIEQANNYANEQDYDQQPIGYMSCDYAYLNSEAPVWQELQAALGARGEHIGVTQKGNAPNANKLVRYAARLATRPIEHGDVVVIKTKSGLERVQVVDRDGKLMLRPYKNFTWLPYVVDRVELDALEEHERRAYERLPQPKHKAVEYYEVTIGGIEGPGDALSAYLRNQHAVPLTPSELRSGRTWGYRLILSSLALRRLTSATKSKPLNEPPWRIAAKFGEITHWEAQWHHRAA